MFQTVDHLGYHLKCRVKSHDTLLIMALAHGAFSVSLHIRTEFQLALILKRGAANFSSTCSELGCQPNKYYWLITAQYLYHDKFDESQDTYHANTSKTPLFLAASHKILWLKLGATKNCEKNDIRGKYMNTNMRISHSLWVNSSYNFGRFLDAPSSLEREASSSQVPLSSSSVPTKEASAADTASARSARNLSASRK